MRTLMTEFNNPSLAEAYGRLDEALDITVVKRRQPTRISVYDGGNVSLSIQQDPEGTLLVARGCACHFEDREFESRGGPEQISEDIKSELRVPFTE